MRRRSNCPSSRCESVLRMGVAVCCSRSRETSDSPSEVSRLRLQSRYKRTQRALLAGPSPAYLNKGDVPMKLLVPLVVAVLGQGGDGSGIHFLVIEDKLARADGVRV